MSKLSDLIEDLVTANRILATQGIVDSFGHVSIRHPDNPKTYFLSRSRAPERVETADIMEFTLEGDPVDAKGRKPYLERFIHGAAYEMRPDVMSVIHNHSPGVDPVRRHRPEDAADHAHVRHHRPRGADLGPAQEVRRHRSAGRPAWRWAATWPRRSARAAPR